MSYKEIKWWCTAFCVQQTDVEVVLQKSAHGWSTEGVGALSSVAACNHERVSMSCLTATGCPRSKYGTNNNVWATSGFEVESWWHPTLWTALYHRELMVRTALVMSTQSCLVDMHSACGCASQSPRVPLHLPCKACSRVGDHLSRLWPYIGNWAKSRGWVLFWGWARFHETTVLLLHRAAA